VEVRLFRFRRCLARVLASLSLVGAVVMGVPAGAVSLSLVDGAAQPPPPKIPLVRAQKPLPTPLPRLRLTGMIETGDADRLRVELEKLAARPGVRPDRPLGIVELSSIGGNLTEGFEIGALLRRFRMVAVVRRGDVCLSSCALALIGGTFHHAPTAEVGTCNVEIGAKVAFHNFFLNRRGLREVTDDDPVSSRLQGFADARGGAAMLIRYAGDMGLQPTLVANMIGRPVEDMQYLETAGQFAAFRLCPIGLGRPATSLETQARNVCANSLEVGTSGLSVRAIPAHEAKLHLLERLQATLQSAKARGRLALQLASAATMRSDDVGRLYDELQMVGVALPDIVGPTFEVTGAQPDSSCFVSLSHGDPDRYDVSLFGPRGFVEPPRQPPDNARRLFLYAPGDMVNPGL
jgi:hypothetical protein